MKSSPHCYVYLDKQKVLKACRMGLKDVRQARRKKRNQYVQEAYSKLLCRWKFFSRISFLGFTKPTLQDAYEEAKASFYNYDSYKYNLVRKYKFLIGICKLTNSKTVQLSEEFLDGLITDYID